MANPISTHPTDLAAVKSSVKETLLGTEQVGDLNLSAQSRANFERCCRWDEQDGSSSSSTATGGDGGAVNSTSKQPSSLLGRDIRKAWMGEAEFINAVAPVDEDFHKIKREQYAILFRVADRKGTGRLSLYDWAAFENLLAKPDAEYEIAFRLFDVDGTGLVKFDHLKKLYEMNKGPSTIAFDWNCDWATLYTGSGRRRHDLTYPQFSQMLRGLQGERIRQAFQLFDKNNDGYIEPEDFQRIIMETAKHKLSDHLLENLHTLCNISAGSKISYANVRAFQNMIREMDLVEMIIRQATSRSADGKITRTEFLNEASRITRFSHFTPMEADILFHFASLDEPSGRLGLSDFAKVLDSSWRNRGVGAAVAGRSRDTAVQTGGSVLHSVLESMHHFALGSLAGAFGAFMVYPIDLVKTRMQNQRSSRVGEMLYKNSWDCAKKVVKNEGFLGLYSGVLPQLVGVAPEKAIKLTVNDLVRGFFTDKDGKIKLGQELVAGGTAGACQVVFTNPLEIVKIRLQVQGEISKAATAVPATPSGPLSASAPVAKAVPRRSALWIVRNLGLVGLYKGASACLLRDVPFSAIYFPTYNHLKRDYFGESPTKKLGVVQLLTAGAIAGMPAAYLTTPCDVIKTRLQVEARKGEASYKNLRHCARTILQEEGFKAFFKGGPARIMRSSPQFGFTLAMYEVLGNILPMPGSRAPEGQIGAGQGIAGASSGVVRGMREGMGGDRPLSYLRSRSALKIILDLDEEFGRVKVPGSQGWKSLPRSIVGKVTGEA